MDVKTCRICGRLFNHVSGPVRCPACMDELERKFQEVKEYIWNHRQAQLTQIAEDTGVSVGQLRQWVREERLSFADDSPVGLECEVCGTMIKTGRFCDHCKEKINSNLSTAIKKEAVAAPKTFTSDHKNKMRYL